jgi:hypothetical protein
LQKPAFEVHRLLHCDFAVVDIGDKEFAAGMAFVALTRVKLFDHLVVEGFPYDRVANLYKNESLKKRLKEEERLRGLFEEI